MVDLWEHRLLILATDLKKAPLEGTEDMHVQGNGVLPALSLSPSTSVMLLGELSVKGDCKTCVRCKING